MNRHLRLLVAALIVMDIGESRVHISKDASLASLHSFGQALQDMRDPANREGTVLKRNHFCDLVKYGSGWGGHEMCNMTAYTNHNASSCYFMSFGISRDYSFDKAVRANANCKGLAFDPSTHYPSTLTEGVKFFEVGANVLPGAGDDYMDGGSEVFMADVPKFADALSLTTLEVLKMDCEGCEYALGGDILGSRHHFFSTVNQFAVEFHLSPFWIKDDSTALELGKLLFLLEAADLRLVSAELTGCGSKSMVKIPCNKLILESHIPCGSNWDPKHPELRCHNLVFSKKP